MDRVNGGEKNFVCLHFSRPLDSLLCCLFLAFSSLQQSLDDVLALVSYNWKSLNATIHRPTSTSRVLRGMSFAHSILAPRCEMFESVTGQLDSYLSVTQLEVARLARKQSNLRLACRLLLMQVWTWCFCLPPVPVCICLMDTQHP